jgi:hypothetical protein
MNLPLLVFNTVRAKSRAIYLGTKNLKGVVPNMNYIPERCLIFLRKAPESDFVPRVHIK